MNAMVDPLVAARLESLIRANRPQASAIRIEELEPIVGGNSSEMWAFKANWFEGDAHHSHSLILRRASPTEFESSDRAAEFRLLKALGATAVPVPKMLWLDPDGNHLGRPAMVMERVPGTAHRRLLVDTGEGALPKQARSRLEAEIPELLAQIHKLDSDPLPLLRATGSAAPAARQLDLVDDEVRRLELEPMPELRLASCWLRERLPPPPPRETLVHGDFRPANLLVEDGRIMAILDWEFAHIGDPAEDLGWYLTPYYAKEHLIAGCKSAAEFIVRYEAAMGAATDRQAIAFWSVFAMYRLAAMTLSALRSFIEGDPSRMAPSARFILDPLLASLSGSGELAR